MTFSPWLGDLRLKYLQEEDMEATQTNANTANTMLTALALREKI
jgi:hypothetical protein